MTCFKNNLWMSLCCHCFVFAFSFLVLFCYCCLIFLFCFVLLVCFFLTKSSGVRGGCLMQFRLQYGAATYMQTPFLKNVPTLPTSGALLWYIVQHISSGWAAGSPKCTGLGRVGWILGWVERQFGANNSNNELASLKIEALSSTYCVEGWTEWEEGNCRQNWTLVASVGKNISKYKLGKTNAEEAAE